MTIRGVRSKGAGVAKSPQLPTAPKLTDIQNQILVSLRKRNSQPGQRKKRGEAFKGLLEARSKKPSPTTPAKPVPLFVRGWRSLPASLPVTSTGEARALLKRFVAKYPGAVIKFERTGDEGGDVIMESSQTDAKGTARAAVGRFHYSSDPPTKLQGNRKGPSYGISFSVIEGALDMTVFRPKTLVRFRHVRLMDQGTLLHTLRNARAIQLAAQTGKETKNAVSNNAAKTSSRSRRSVAASRQSTARRK
jgi:hypothetical protein